MVVNGVWIATRGNDKGSRWYICGEKGTINLDSLHMKYVELRV